MTFLKKHRPLTVNDLVFRDPRHGETIQRYANGTFNDYLLLSGPPGSGKSEAARIILESRLGVGTDGGSSQTFYGGKMCVESIENLPNITARHVFYGFNSGCIVIDEVDFLEQRERRTLRKVIDEGLHGLLICTTNHPHKLEEAFLNRFDMVHLDVPLVEDWVTRAQAIMRAEGIDLTLDQVNIMLKGFEGSARDFLRWLERSIIDLKAQHPSFGNGSMQSSLQPAVTIPINPQQMNGWATLGGEGTQKKP